MLGCHEPPEQLNALRFPKSLKSTEGMNTDLLKDITSFGVLMILVSNYQSKLFNRCSFGLRSGYRVTFLYSNHQ